MNYQNNFYLKFSALSGAIAVMLGAFGAHALKGKIAPELMQAYQTSVQYHFVHTLALLFVACVLSSNSRLYRVSANAFCIGIVLFSGSLYILAITGVRAFGMITPLGGIAFILAWLSFFMALVLDKSQCKSK